MIRYLKSKPLLHSIIIYYAATLASLRQGGVFLVKD